MEGVARHLNMIIPQFVPISPFKDTDAPPALQAPVKYEHKNTGFGKTEGSVLRKDGKNVSGNLNSVQSGEATETLDEKVETSGNVRYEYGEEKPGINLIEDCQSELSSEIQPGVRSSCCDSSFVETSNCQKKADIVGEKEVKNDCQRSDMNTSESGQDELRLENTSDHLNMKNARSGLGHIKSGDSVVEHENKQSHISESVKIINDDSKLPLFDSSGTLFSQSQHLEVPLKKTKYNKDAGV